MLINCEECGKEISDKSALCIHCGCPIERATEQPIETIIENQIATSPPAQNNDNLIEPENSEEKLNVKNAWYKKWWVWVIVAFVFITIIANVGGKNSTKSANTQTQTTNSTVQSTPIPTSVPTPTPTPTPTPQSKFQLNELIKQNNGLSYYVSSISFQETVSSGYLYYTADGTYLIINITFENNGSSPLSIGSAGFDLVDSDGASYVRTELYSAPGHFDQYSVINPKAKKSYKLYYDISNKSLGYTLRSQSTIYGADDIVSGNTITLK